MAAHHVLVAFCVLMNLCILIADIMDISIVPIPSADDMPVENEGLSVGGAAGARGRTSGLATTMLKQLRKIVAPIPDESSIVAAFGPRASEAAQLRRTDEKSPICDQPDWLPGDTPWPSCARLSHPWQALLLSRATVAGPDKAMCARSCLQLVSEKRDVHKKAPRTAHRGSRVPLTKPVKSEPEINDSEHPLQREMTQQFVMLDASVNLALFPVLDPRNDTIIPAYRPKKKKQQSQPEREESGGRAEESEEGDTKPLLKPLPSLQRLSIVLMAHRGCAHCDTMLSALHLLPDFIRRFAVAARLDHSLRSDIVPTDIRYVVVPPNRAAHGIGREAHVFNPIAVVPAVRVVREIGATAGGFSIQQIGSDLDVKDPSELLEAVLRVWLGFNIRNALRQQTTVGELSRLLGVLPVSATHGKQLDTEFDVEAAFEAAHANDLGAVEPIFSVTARLDEAMPDAAGIINLLNEWETEVKAVMPLTPSVAENESNDLWHRAAAWLERMKDAVEGDVVALGALSLWLVASVVRVGLRREWSR